MVSSRILSIQQPIPLPDMQIKHTQTKRPFWIIVPPWIIMGAVLILVPLFIFMTLEYVDRQKNLSTRLLVEKGAALIRSFEAGARTGIGMEWGRFQLQKLLMETAQQQDIDYIIVTDVNGNILADSDPSTIGESYGQDLDLKGIAQLKRVEWRQVKNTQRSDTFEVFRRFSPTPEPFPGFQGPLIPDRPSPSRNEIIRQRPPELIIFVGLDMGPIEEARKQDAQHTIWMAVILLLVGFSGVITLFIAHNYRLARTSLSRVKALSDSLVENMPIGLIALDENEEIIAFNQTAETVLQKTAESVIGQKAQTVLPAPCRDILQNLKDGRGFIETEIDCPVGEGKNVPLEVIGSILEEEEGNFLGYVLLLRDLSEVQQLKREIARSLRLASLGSLAAGVAHEIRNPLSSIKGFATYFRERSGDRPEDRNVADILIQEVERLNRVISQLSEFARPMSINRQWSSLQMVIQHALTLIEKQSLDRKIVLHADLPPEIQDITIDPDRIKQVLLNLLLNAIAAMEQGGTLSVRLTRHDEKTVRIDIDDTGVGIRKEDLSRIFDPYFTTKPSGTGLGLAIAHKIIEAHNGEIRVTSEIGQGTTVSVFLPISNPYS